VSLPSSSTDNPEEIEIDRLLRELGIVLPAVESVAIFTQTADANEAPPLIDDDAGDLRDDEIDVTDDWLPPTQPRMTPWPPEAESY